MAKLSRRALLQGSLASALAAPLAYITGVSLGGYKVHQGLLVLSSKEAQILEAVGEAFVPPDNEWGVSIYDVELVKSADEMMAAMPDGNQSQIKWMLWSTEHILPLRLFRFRKFSRLPVSDRQELLEALEQSGNVSVRAAFRVLKGIVQAIYFNHPRAYEKIGFKEKCRA